MENDKLNRALGDAPEVKIPDQLQAKLLSNFDDYQRTTRKKNGLGFAWFIPTAGSLASLSVGLFAGMATAPAAADTVIETPDTDNYEVVTQWQGDAWLLESVEDYE